MIAITPRFVKDARRALGWSQFELAHRAGIGLETVAHFEAGRRSQVKTKDAIASALQRDGKVAFDEDTKSLDGPGDAEAG